MYCMLTIPMQCICLWQIKILNLEFIMWYSSKTTKMRKINTLSIKKVFTLPIKWQVYCWTKVDEHSCSTWPQCSIKLWLDLDRSHPLLLEFSIGIMFFPDYGKSEPGQILADRRATLARVQADPTDPRWKTLQCYA